MLKRSLIYCLTFGLALLCAIAIPSFARPPEATPTSLTAPSEAALLEQQAKAAYRAGQWAEAITALQQASQLYQAQANHLRQAVVLSNLALTYQQSGNIPAANQAIQESLEILAGLPSSPNQLSAQILDIQGRLQFTQGQTEAALSTWQQAAERYQQLQDNAGLARNQIDQSRALQALGFYQRAIDQLVQVLELPSQIALSPEQRMTLDQDTVSLQALLGLQDSILNEDELDSLLQALLQPLPASRNTAVALQNLGEILRNSGSLAQADRVLQQALRMAQSSPELTELAPAISLDLGNTALAQNQRETALQRYQQAAHSTAITTRIRAQVNELSLQIDHANWAAAQQLAAQIQPQLASLPLSQTTLYAQINFAQSLIKLSATAGSTPTQTAEIEALLSQTQDQAEQLQDPRAVAYAAGTQGHLYEVLKRWPEAKTHTQQALQSSQALVNLPKQGFSAAPDIRYLWQWQIGRILKAEAEQGRDAAPYQAATDAYRQALASLQSLRLDLVSANRDEQFNFREIVEPAYREYIQLLLRSAPTGKITDPNVLAQEDLVEARQALQALQTAELQNFLRAGCINVPIIDLDTTVSNTSKAQATAVTALVYPIVLPDRLSVVLKLPDQPLLHYSTQVSQDDVKTTLEKLRGQLTSPIHFELTEAQQLYDWLIGPASEVLQNHKITTLVFVLDGILQKIPMAALHDGSQYLIQKYSIALAPGLEIPDPQPLPTQGLRLLLAGISQSVTIDDTAFPVLATAEQQMSEIKQAGEAEGYRVNTLFNQDFVAKKLRRNLQDFPSQVVHLITHGKFSAERDGTYIVSFERKIKIAELSQILRSREQSQPDPIELLVLSACDTAKDDRAELGMAGIAVQSGARSTVASLWKIADDAAEVFMPEFYRQLNDRDLTKAEALRKAQISLIEHPNPTLNRPLNWAPFVLLGNWL